MLVNIFDSPSPLFLRSDSDNNLSLTDKLKYSILLYSFKKRLEQ